MGREGGGGSIEDLRYLKNNKHLMTGPLGNS